MDATKSHEKSSSPLKLLNETYNSQIFFIYMFITLISLFLALFLLVESNLNPDFQEIIIIISFLGVCFLISGSTYNEYMARYDFLELTAHSVKYQNSSKFFRFGWLPERGEIKYNEINSIQIIQIKTGLDIIDEKVKQAQFNPEGFFKKNIIIEISLKSGKLVRLGERLSSSSLFQLAVLIEGRAQLSNVYTKFQEKFPDIASITSEALNKMKNIFRKK